MIMMIFVTTTDALADEKLYEKAYSLIPEYRKVKVDKMKMRENKLQTVTAGLLLNYAVGKWRNRVNKECDSVYYENVDIFSVIEANNQLIIRKENLIFCHFVKFFSIFLTRLTM